MWNHQVHLEQLQNSHLMTIHQWLQISETIKFLKRDILFSEQPYPELLKNNPIKKSSK